MDKKASLKLFVEQTYLVAKAAVDSDSSKISKDDNDSNSIRSYVIRFLENLVYLEDHLCR